MTNLQRHLYGLILRLHPASFRQEFGGDMALDFSDALRERGFLALFGDGLLSLTRQWTARAFALRETQHPVSRHPFLSGQYPMMEAQSLSMFDLARASAVWLLLVLALGYAVNNSVRRTIASTQSARVGHDGGVDSTRNNRFAASNEEHREAAGHRADLPAESYAGAPFHGRIRVGHGGQSSQWGARASGGPPAAMSLVSALRELGMISLVVWLTSLLMRRNPGVVSKIVLSVLGVLGIAASVAFASVPMSAVHPQAPLPTSAVHYKVATGQAEISECGGLH